MHGDQLTIAMFCSQVHHGAWPVPNCWGGWLHIGRRSTIDVTNHWQLSSDDWGANRKCKESMPVVSDHYREYRDQCSGDNSKIWVGRRKCPSNAGESYCTYCQMSS